ncbi:hypothetical protein BIFPSEUDO_04508, partial [Bifidobacterium pseudocatenulatum DSM 20438 = JCM 1200 = LMG 10505]
MEKNFSPLADEIIKMMDSYTELSPSGNGVHIIVKGELPIQKGRPKKSRNRFGNIPVRTIFHIYRKTRRTYMKLLNEPMNLHCFLKKYFEDKKPEKKTVTNTFSHISNLSNSELWEKMFNSRNGQNIRSLFEGNLINDDHSSTDLALCNHPWL